MDDKIIPDDITLDVEEGPLEDTIEDSPRFYNLTVEETQNQDTGLGACYVDKRERIVFSPG